MTFIIILALIVCVIALVMTLFSISTVDTNYNMNSSLKNMSVIYVIIIPIAGVIAVVAWLIFS